MKFNQETSYRKTENGKHYLLKLNEETKELEWVEINTDWNVQ
jgi:hypothetical protein